MPITSVSLQAKAGRPRSAQADRAVLAAAHALVREGGYPAATIDAIAARSGVAKTTIYRRWPNRPTLVVDLLLQLAAKLAPPPAGRDPLRALRTELQLVAKASAALPGRLLLSLLGAAQHDPEVATALRQGLFTPRRQATAVVIREAQRRGLVRKDVDPLLVVDLLFGPLFYRKFLRQEPLSDVFVSQVFLRVLAGLKPPTAAAPPRRRAAARSARTKPGG